MQNRRGAVIPIVAVCIVMLVGMAAIAIDIGMLYDSRAEAQRAADASALAGASGLWHYRDEAAAVKQGAATVRALETAGMNYVRGTPVEPSEVAIEFLQNNSRIAATVTRADMSPLFASIFGVNSLQVAATAHAMYYQGGSAKCLKPFGVPDSSSLTLADVGDRVLIWRGNAQETYPLFRYDDTESNNVRDRIVSQSCNNRLVEVGNILGSGEAQSATAGMQGQVVQGVDELIQLDADLGYNTQYNPALFGQENDGFNHPYWRSSPRALNLILYDPETMHANHYKVTGFMTAFIDGPVEVVRGTRELYAIVLPHRPPSGSGPCTPPNCSGLSWWFRLVQ
jgi:hypothetical protein